MRWPQFSLLSNFTLREKLMALVLVAVSIVAVAQLGFASVTSMPGSPGRYSEGGMQPFERAEHNFPGSAFYWLESDSGLLSPDIADQAWADSDAALDAPAGTGDALTGPGPSAHSIRASGSSLDRTRALQCLATAIYYEAATEPDAGQRGVAQVILNRVAHPSYPDTVCGVVYQGSERRTGCQFSFTCDGSLARRPSAMHWNRALKVAQDALSGYVYAPVGLATHYHATYVYPYWAPSLHYVGTIGLHRFYRWKGSAGQRSAFYKSYRGGEPLPAPKPRSLRDDPKVDNADPIALAKAFEQGRAEAQREAAAAEARAAEYGRLNGGSTIGLPAPVPGRASMAAPAVPQYAPPAYAPEAARKGGDSAYRADHLPGDNNIRAEYRDSGKWISDPAK